MAEEVAGFCWDFNLAIGCSLGFAVARFLLDVLIYRPLGSSILPKCGTAAKVATSDESKILKWSESMWKLTYYASMQIWVLSIMQQESWALLNTEEYFQGWPNQELTFFRIGTVILALHDTSDVFLEMAKLFKYSEKEMAASVCFGLFVVSWLILRLIFFPFWIIKASSYQSIESLRMLDPFPIALYYVFNTMLLMLLVFHVYWWKLINAMIMKQWSNRGKVGEDIRSDSEIED